jgi:hypothetical protein
VSTRRHSAKRRPDGRGDERRRQPRSLLRRHARGIADPLTRTSRSTNGASTVIEVPTSGEVEEFISYATDIALYDPLGALLVNTPVTVWTNEIAEVQINGAVYFIESSEPALVSSNGAGIHDK